MLTPYHQREPVGETNSRHQDELQHGPDQVIGDRHSLYEKSNENGMENACYKRRFYNMQKLRVACVPPDALI